MIFLRGRYYDPGTGRFITRDSFPSDKYLTQDINKYVYTGNNPVNRIDPSGRWFEIDDGFALCVGLGWGFGSQYESDVAHSWSAGKTGLDAWIPTSSWEVYTINTGGTALNAWAATNVGEAITTATLNPIAGLTAGTSTFTIGYTAINRAEDMIEGKPLDLKDEAMRGSFSALTDKLLDGIPFAPDGSEAFSWPSVRGELVKGRMSTRLGLGLDMPSMSNNK